MLKKITYALVCLAFAACSGTIDPNAGNTDSDNDPTKVPEGVLRIFADKTEISADGNDEVTFTIMFGSEDVSNAKTLQLIREYDGDQKFMAYGANKFSTVTAGTYRFTAKYYYGGNYITDNSVTVEAKQFFTGETKEYEQRVLATYFTSTGCTSCPLATKGIQTLQEANPGKISVVALHLDMTVSDPMITVYSYDFQNALGGFTGLPAFFLNMKEDTYTGGASFTEVYSKEIGSYKPQSGVKIQTSENGARSYKIDIGVTSNTPSVYRYLVFLVEDGIVAEQTGEKDYVHNNVLRTVLTDVSGDKLNDNLPLTEGVEFKATKSVVLESEWVAENMRVIVAATTTTDGGYSYVVNNVSECTLGGEVDYKYAE